MIEPLSPEKQRELHSTVVEDAKRSSRPSSDRHGILVMGLSGSGKSVLAPRLLGELSTRGDSGYALVDFDEYATAYPGYLKSIREDPLGTTHQVITEMAPILVDALKEIAGSSSFIHNHIFNSGDQAREFLGMFRNQRISTMSLVVISEPLTVSEVGLAYRNDPKAILEGRSHYIPPGVSSGLQAGMVDGLNAIDAPGYSHLYDEALFISRRGTILAHKYPSGSSSHPDMPLGHIYRAAQESRTFERSEIDELLRQVDVVEHRPGSGPPWNYAPPWPNEIRNAIHALPKATGKPPEGESRYAAGDILSAVAASATQRPHTSPKSVAPRYVLPSLPPRRGRA